MAAGVVAFVGQHHAAAVKWWNGKNHTPSLWAVRIACQGGLVAFGHKRSLPVERREASMATLVLLAFPATAEPTPLRPLVCSPTPRASS